MEGIKTMRNEQDKTMFLVEMHNLKDSMKAVGLFHNYELEGKKIQISFTKSSLNEWILEKKKKILLLLFMVKCLKEQTAINFQVLFHFTIQFIMATLQFIVKPKLSH